MGVLNIDEQFAPVIDGKTLIEKRQFTRSAFNNVVFNNMTVETFIGATNQPKVIISVQYHLTWDEDTQTLTVLPQAAGSYFRKFFNVCFERIELHKPSLPEIDAVMTTEYLSTRFTDYPQVKSPYTYTYEG